MRHILDHKLFNIRLGFIILCLYWVALFAGTHLPGKSLPSTGHNDKVQHFLAYFGLAVLCSVVIWPSPFASKASAPKRVPALKPNFPHKRKRSGPIKKMRRWVQGSVWRSSLLISVVLISYGAVDEITQAFSPGRNPELADFVADALGVFTGLLFCFCIRSVYVGLVYCFSKPVKRSRHAKGVRRRPASMPMD